MKYINQAAAQLLDEKDIAKEELWHLLYGYRDFLRLINSKNPDDADEKEDYKNWAKGMGWTGRKVKPENML